MANNVPDAMLHAIADYLKFKGWSVAVIGDPRVQKQPTEATFNYEFVVRFTGSPPKEEANHGTATTTT